MNKLTIDTTNLSQEDIEQLETIKAKAGRGGVMKSKLRIKLGTGARLPEKANPTDAGIDIFASAYQAILPRQRALISTGLYMEIPEGFCIFIKSRSGLAAKDWLDVEAGVVDQDYRGEVRVLISNNSDRTFRIDEGDKIAQMVLLPVPAVEIKEVTTLSSTNRGANGFGSTGK